MYPNDSGLESGRGIIPDLLEYVELIGRYCRLMRCTAPESTRGNQLVGNRV